MPHWPQHSATRRRCPESAPRHEPLKVVGHAPIVARGEDRMTWPCFTDHNPRIRSFKRPHGKRGWILLTPTLEVGNPVNIWEPTLPTPSSFHADWRPADLPPATPNLQPRGLSWKKDADGSEEHPRIALGAVGSRRPPAPNGCSDCSARREDLRRLSATRHANLGNRKPQTESPSENRTPPASGLPVCGSWINCMASARVDGLTDQPKASEIQMESALSWAGCWPTSPPQELTGVHPKRVGFRNERTPPRS